MWIILTLLSSLDLVSAGTETSSPAHLVLLHKLHLVTSNYLSHNNFSGSFACHVSDNSKTFLMQLLNGLTITYTPYPQNKPTTNQPTNNLAVLIQWNHCLLGLGSGYFSHQDVFHQCISNVPLDLWKPFVSLLDIPVPSEWDERSIFGGINEKRVVNQTLLLTVRSSCSDEWLWEELPRT